MENISVELQLMADEVKSGFLEKNIMFAKNKLISSCVRIDVTHWKVLNRCIFVCAFDMEMFFPALYRKSNQSNRKRE